MTDTPNKPTDFDPEETALVQQMDADERAGYFKSVLTDDRKQELMATARIVLNPPKKQLTTRFYERDIQRLKAKAMEKGIPYQVLLASIAHQYVEGTLVERG